MPYKRLPPLNALRAYEAVARHGSFKSAANELSVTPAALSQQVKKLEEDVGISLFVKQGRNVVPTLEGATLKAGLSEAFLRMREAVDGVASRPERTSLMVSCGGPVASKWLAPRIGSFFDQHPDIHISINSSKKLVDFSSEDIDFGIRFSRDESEDLERQWLFEETAVAVCSPDFAERHRMKEARDVLRVPILRDDGLSFCRGPIWEVWCAEAGLPISGARRGAHFGSATEQAIDAAIAGAGILVTSKTLVSLDLEMGRLVIPFGPEVSTHVRYQLVHPPTRQPRAPLEAFKNWVRREFVPYQTPIVSI